MLARLNKELEDLIRRARELASWIISALEPESRRLAQRIEDVRKRKSFPPPAAAAKAPVLSYDYRRRPTP